jgi:hypothetical protein
MSDEWVRKARLSGVAERTVAVCFLSPKTGDWMRTRAPAATGHSGGSTVCAPDNAGRITRAACMERRNRIVILRKSSLP